MNAANRVLADRSVDAPTKDVAGVNAAGNRSCPSAVKARLEAASFEGQLGI